MGIRQLSELMESGSVLSVSKGTYANRRSNKLLNEMDKPLKIP